MKIVLFGLILFLAGISTAAQEAASVVPLSRQTVVRAGPGHTWQQIDLLRAGTPVMLEKRNPIGNWLSVSWESTGDISAGWVAIDALDLDGSTLLSAIPIDAETPHADLQAISDETLAALYAIPILPAIDDSLRDVFERGQALGNQAGVAAKIGDSNSAYRLYLAPISRGAYDLGPYDFLQATVDLFGESFGIESVATRVGMNAFSVFDPAWASPSRCQPGESPLECELRRTQPSVAVIMFGINDTRVLNSGEYEQQIQQMVEVTLEAGVIPVLVAFSANPVDEKYFQVLRFNLITAAVAEDYRVPFVNFWAAARALPRGGIGLDNAHLTESGQRFELGEFETRFGLTLHNLLILHTLDAIRQTIIEV